MQRHPLLHRLTESMPLVRLLANEPRPRRMHELVERTNTDFALLDYHLGKLGELGWLSVRGKAYLLSAAGRRVLTRPGAWFLRQNEFEHPPVITGGASSRAFGATEAQRTLRIISWRWQALAAVVRREEGTAREIAEEAGVEFGRGWAYRHLTPLIRVGLVERDEGAGPQYPPAYWIGAGGARWLKQGLLDWIHGVDG